jgi:hypothetical protein
MLLNKIPVLDKGYVALLDSSMTTQTMRDIGTELYGGEYPIALEELGTMTVAIKCPLFVQLFLSKYDLKVLNANSGNLEAYLPHPGDIGAPERLDSEAIADDISRTTDALLINPKSYQADGCDRFMSQLTTPINVYTTLIVSGSYSEWCKLAYEKKLPGPVEAYCIALGQIITAEWK